MSNEQQDKELHNALVNLAMSFYLGERCKYCGKMYKTLADLDSTVWAGYHKYGRLACETCWKKAHPQRIFREHTKLRLQYLALRRAETVAYNADKEAHRKYFETQRKARQHNLPPRKSFAAWRAAADAVNAFQQAHKEMFEYE